MPVYIPPISRRKFLATTLIATSGYLFGFRRGHEKSASNLIDPDYYVLFLVTLTGGISARILTFTLSISPPLRAPDQHSPQLISMPGLMPMIFILSLTALTVLLLAMQSGRG